MTSHERRTVVWEIRSVLPEARVTRGVTAEWWFLGNDRALLYPDCAGGPCIDTFVKTQRTDQQNKTHFGVLNLK